jgi:hypothetical protein
MKDFRSVMKVLAHSKSDTRAHHLQFAIMRAMAAVTEHDRFELASLIVQSAFSPITQEIKLLNNGNNVWQGLRFAIDETFEAYDSSENQLLSCLEGTKEREWFQDILCEIQAYAVADALPPGKEYVYFFVRTDISQEQQVVQNSHVALKLGAELAKHHIDTDDLYFVVCNAFDEEELYDFEAFFHLYDVPTVRFFEPDLGNSLTAFATFPIPERKKNRYFKQFSLLTYNKENEVI